MKPEHIESSSFDIIDNEAGDHAFSPRQWEIVRRMIHTTADFDYMNMIHFHPRAIDAGIDAIRRGRPIFTDTHMAEVGIRNIESTHFHVAVTCLITDPAVVQAAARNGTTRAQAAVDAAAPDMEGGIYVIGNAPTALLRLIDLVAAGRARPALIIGLPVGFVNAAESKAKLTAMDYPCISNTGRKGGSTVAACVVNALLKMAASQSA